MNKVTELTGMSWLVTVPTFHLEISRHEQSHRTHRYVMAGHSTNSPSGNIPTLTKSQNSQVCHGWSQYQLSIWKYPDMNKVTELTGMSWLVTVPTLLLEISRHEQSHRAHRYVMAGHSTNSPSGISRLDQSHRTHRYVMAGHSTNFPSGNIPT